MFRFLFAHTGSYGFGSRRPSRSSGLAEDGAVTPYCDLPHPRHPHRQVGGTIGRGIERSGSRPGDRPLSTSREPGPFEIGGKHPSMFPTLKEPWYQASDEDVPK
jgi:hypothetical protein